MFNCENCPFKKEVLENGDCVRMAKSFWACGWSNEPMTIKSIDSNKIATMTNGRNIHCDNLELVKPFPYKYNKPLICDFKFKQNIEVSDDNKKWYPMKFWRFDSDSSTPFVAVNNNCTELYWKYARVIKPEYVPYSEPKLEWLRKIIIDKETNRKFIISSISKSLENEYILFSTIGTNLSMSIRLPILFRDYTWSDGSPCGELKD